MVELGVGGVGVGVVLVVGVDVGAAAGQDVIGRRDLGCLGRVALLRALLLRLVGYRRQHLDENRFERNEKQS